MVLFDATLLLYPGDSRLNRGLDPIAVPPEALWRVALDVPAVSFDLALCALFAPAQMLDGDPGGRLIDVETNRRAHPDHRAPQQRVGEGLGHLVAKGVDYLGADQ